MGMAPNWGAVRGGWGRTEGFVLKDRLPLLAMSSAKEVECIRYVLTLSVGRRCEHYLLIMLWDAPPQKAVA